ncbi:MAG: YbjN domain-containing protein [Betaproteobacteria bacterium]|nr:YbjN domain-containing protein [Betaproteobacteria bacterium]
MARQQKQAASEVSSPAAPAKSLFERVAGYLDANDWNYTANEEKKYFSTGCRIKDASVRVILDTNESEDWQRVLVYSCFPVFVPEDRRAAVAETISRINYTMIFGNLEMDPSDGEVRVRSIVESDGALSDSMIERALASNLDTANRFFAPTFAVAFGNTAPATVLDPVAQQGTAAVAQTTTIQ